MSDPITSGDITLSDTLRRHMRLKTQVEILYSQSALTFIFPVFFACLITIILWEIGNRTILIAWLVTIIIYACLRYMLLWLYQRSQKKNEQKQKWLDLFVFSACMSGLMWGCAGIILIPYQADKLIEFTLYNGLTMLTVCGLVAGAVISYCPSMTVLLFYAFPALIPPAIYLISLGDIYNSTLGGFIFLYFIFVTLAAYKMNRNLAYFMQKDFEYSQLLQEYQKLKKLYKESIKENSAG